jgi:DeoR family fructose operon transcriptional repressor
MAFPGDATMVAEERRARLLELIRLRGFASLPELAEALAVSESTVRRDVDALEQSGAARRTHGGVLYAGPTPKIPHFEARQSMNWEKKRAIARRAAQCIEEGDTVLLDGGSTTYELARELVGRVLQVVTNSLPVANLFTGSDGVDLVFIGGYLHGRTGVTLGPYANQMLEQLNVRRAVLSVAGVNVQGYYNSNLLLVETERAMMKAADEVIVVADSTKFGRSSLALLCPLADVDRVVVDSQISPVWRERLEQAGVEVIVAELPEASTAEGDSRRAVHAS